MKKLTVPGQVQYRTTQRQFGICLVRYRTETTDAGASFFDADAQLWYMLTRAQILKHLL
jgi:hypothetical protein